MSEYCGFLSVECEKCGETREFCAREPISVFRCDCGHRTPLDGLIPAYVNCECGRRWKYLTNRGGRRFTIECLACGYPIDMECNKRGTAFVPMARERRSRKKKGKTQWKN